MLGEVYHSAIEGDVIDINQGFLSQNAVKELAALARYRIADLCDNFPVRTDPYTYLHTGPLQDGNTRV